MRMKYEVRLKINKPKTKIVVIDKNGQVTRTGELIDLEAVYEFL